MKKILFLLLLLLTPFMVIAETCDDSKIVIESAFLKDTKGIVDETKELSIDGKTLNFNISMLEPGDSANYDITIKNNSNFDYEIDFSNIKSNSEYITYKVTSDNNSKIIPAGKTLGVSLLITYNQKVPTEQFVDGVFKDNNNIILNLYNEQSNPLTLTNKNMIIIGVLSLIVIISFVLLIKTQKKSFIIPVIITVMMITVGVKALCKRELEVKANINIRKELITNIFQMEEGYLSAGDEILIGNDEHFYVISSDENKTVLLAKYTLHVGEVYENGIRVKTLSSSDFGYGLQNKTTSYNHTSNENTSIGMVPFSGKKYWLDENDNILEQYGSSNYEIMTGVAIYDNNYSSDQYIIDENSLDENDYCHEYSCKAIENNYSVSYFVNKYVDRLEQMGLEVDEGRLLKDTEASALGCGTGNSNYAFCPISISWLYYDNFWIDGLYDRYNPRILIRHQMSFEQNNEISSGVRPVIVIDTSLISLKDHDYFVNRPPIHQ